MSDELRRIGKDSPAGGVVEVAVAIEHVTDGHAESLLHLSPQPGGEIPVDWIRHDDAFRRDEEERVVQIILRSIEISRDF